MITGSMDISLTGVASNVRSGITYTNNLHNFYEAVLSPVAGITKSYVAGFTSNQTLVLNDGSLVDATGTPQVFSNVLIIIINNNDTGNNLTVGGGTTPILPAINIMTGKCTFALVSTLAVTGSTCLLSITGSSTSYDVYLFGN